MCWLLKELFLELEKLPLHPSCHPLKQSCLYDVCVVSYNKSPLTEVTFHVHKYLQYKQPPLYSLLSPYRGRGDSGEYMHFFVPNVCYFEDSDLMHELTTIGHLGHILAGVEVLRINWTYVIMENGSWSMASYFW